MPRDKDRRNSRQQDYYDDDDDDTRSARRGSSMLHLAEDLIRKFSGTDGVYTVTEWIQEIDDNGDVFDWSPTQRLLVARRSLTGTAALWLRAEKTYKSWDELQAAISKEFPDNVDAKFIHEALSSRRKGRNESCLDYMLTMKALGKRGRLPDYVTIKYIVDGIDDAEINKIILYGVKTYNDLKEKLNIYETIASKTKKQTQARTPSGSGGYSKAVHLPRTVHGVTRCYSCGEKNHVSAECPHKSQGRKCFHCNEFGHLAADCRARNTNKMAAVHTTRSTPAATISQSGYEHHGQISHDRKYDRNELQAKQVYVNSTHDGATVYDGCAVSPTSSATTSHRNIDSKNCVLIGQNSKMENYVGDTDMSRHYFDSEEVNKHRKVRTVSQNMERPIKTIEINGKEFSALVDSGSDVNLISENCLIELKVENYNKSANLTMTGLGCNKVSSIGEFVSQVYIDGTYYNDVKFHVVAQRCMPYRIILGNEFLQNVVTVMKGGSVWVNPMAEWLYEVNCVACSSDCLGHVINPAVKEEVTQLVESYQPHQTKEAPIELRIIMKDSIPVAQRPRRISHMEQEEVNRQINEWLCDGIIRLQLIYLTLCSLSQAAYISRMATVNRIRAPTAFRPGVNLQAMHRPWMHQRLVPAASHRVPYVVYRNSPHRYAMKHYGPTNRPIYPQHWKTAHPSHNGHTTARLPSGTPEYEFVRAASAQNVVHNDGGTGAIHTIPAPNLSLSEKPIVVVDSDGFMKQPTAEPPKQTYEVTEKYLEPGVYQMSPKIEVPVGFSKPNILSSPEIQSLLRNGALQFASDYGLSIALPKPPVSLPQQFTPQQFTMQGFNGVPTHQDLMNAGAEGIVIPPHALYQSDPSFLQKLQAQLMQQFPSLEFIPYAANAPTISFPQTQPQLQPQIQPNVQNHLFLLENEEVTKQTPSSFELPKNLVQRETHESAVMSLIPQSFTVHNVTENQIELTSESQPQNLTVELVTAESHPSTTTVKYIIESTTQQKENNQQNENNLSTQELNATPIYYAQVGQSIGNVVANGFYSAINDVRAAAALAQVEKPQEKENLTTTTINPDIKTYFVQQQQPPEGNNTNTVELKPLLGVPFAKTADSVNIAYTLLRANNQEPKVVTKTGAVYAGQIVEAKISEDQDFNKEKATFVSRRAPLRILTVTEKKDMVTSTSAPPKITVVKAKIPPKSKLTFDDKTGEPVLRIYASYVDSPLQKELLTSKLNNMKHVKEMVVKKPDGVENWTSAMVKKADKTQGHDANQVTDFGLKLRSRSDDYIPLFEEYEE